MSSTDTLQGVEMTAPPPCDGEHGDGSDYKNDTISSFQSPTDNLHDVEMTAPSNYDNKNGTISLEQIPIDVKVKDAASAQMQTTHYLLAGCQAILIVLFAVFCDGDPNGLSNRYFTGDTIDNHTRATDGYNLYVGVMIMMLLGFGYLMTFIKTYGLGAVGFCLIVTALGLQWSLLTHAFFEKAYHDEWTPVSLNLYDIYINVTFIACPLISLGAVIGKITPLQLMIMTIIELLLHAVLDRVILFGALGLKDVGATFGVHMFACYFGLAVTWVFGKPSVEPSSDGVSDVFSFIGTTLLWVYWPSFVAGFLEVDSIGQQHAYTNTIICLCGSTVMAFVASSYFNPTKGSFKLRPADIQNATLAGGVAIGCIADCRLNPGIVLLIGSVVGGVSAFGYCHIQGFLLENFNLHDTCGINNLHGMPSVIGASASIFVALATKNDVTSDVYENSQSKQAGIQAICLVVCLAYGIVSGLIVGKFLTLFQLPEGQSKQFHDAVWWEVGGHEPEEEKEKVHKHIE